MADLFAAIVGQDRAKAVLARALEEGESHAYLFYGPEGVGKTTTARAFAAGLICADRGCGTCNTCRRVLHELTHPDLFELVPEGNDIRIEQIREILRDAARRPFEIQSRAKVYVIHEADAITLEAANALLRTLEEPPSHVRFILISERPEKILPTISSRCQHIAFSRLLESRIAAALKERLGLSDRQALHWARVAGGEYAYAVELATTESARQQRWRLLDLARDLPEFSFADTESALDEVMGVVESRAEARAAELQAAKEQAVEWAVTGREKAREEKRFDDLVKRQKRRLITQGLRIVIQTFSGWYRDLALVAVGAEHAVANQDRLDELQLFAFPESVPAYVEAVEIARKAQQRLRYNVDARCAIGDMFYSIKEALTQWPK